MLSTKVYFSKKLDRNLNLLEVLRYSFIGEDKEKSNELNLIEHDENKEIIIDC